MSEQKIQAKILQWLKKNDFYTVKVVLATKKGVPDIIACSPEGTFVAIEVKQPGKNPTRLQDYNLAQVEKRGGIAFVATSVEDVKSHLEFTS